MKGIVRMGSLLIALLMVTPMIAMAQMQTVKDIAGIWQGSLDVSGTKLRLVIKVTRKADKTLTATLDSIDQGAKGIPIDAVTLKDDTAKFEIKAIRGVYEGKLSADGNTITGDWSQGANSLPLVIKRDANVPSTKRPQEPKLPYPYVAEEVSYLNEKGPARLAGTLTYPKGKGPFPVVLLITGSGPQNRDEELLGHKPFLILADYLTRQGIAVLRVDDRGVGKSTGNFPAATTADFATDVLAGIAYLKTRKEIDPAQIGLIGHSEGGVIAPLVASQSKDVAYIVMMAGTGVPGSEIITKQGALIARAAGAPDEIIESNIKTQEKAFAILREEKDLKVAEEKITTLIKESIAALPEAQRKAMGDPEKMAKTQIQTLSAPWMRYFLTYDPRPALRKVNCPVLAINGEKDLQVDPDQNLPPIEAALKEAENKDVTIMRLPGLNHLFQTSTTGAPSEYNLIEETLSPKALKVMGDWIRKHTIEKQGGR